MRLLLLTLVALALGCAAQVAQQPPTIGPAAADGAAVPERLTPIARFDCPDINESSALVRGRLWPEVFWTLNDSGDTARIFPVTRTGVSIKPEWDPGCAGLVIGEAMNIDWEDIAVTGTGELIIGDCGNNGNARRDLALYIVPEPAARLTSATRAARRYLFRYPDQTEFPPSATSANFDCEAVFWARDHVYLLTKHRGDTSTNLYRFDNLDPLGENVPVKLATFAIGGMVTAADASPSGQQIAVLTYNAIWLFEAPAGTDDYFGGTIRWLPIAAGQCEAICFDGDTLIITNEEKDIFHVPVSRLRAYQPGAAAEVGD